MENNWNKYPNKKPNIGQEVLIFCQGYDITGERYWSDFELAIYDKNVFDKRKNTFYKSLDYQFGKLDNHLGGAWQYKDVTHWIPLPESPLKITNRERVSFTIQPKGGRKKRVSFLVRR